MKNKIILNMAMKMEQKVKKEFERVLSLEVSSIEKTKYGVGNHNFFITDINGKKYVFKAFKNSDWPEEYKNRWVSKVLTEKNIRFPKVLFEERKSPEFEFGFMIIEFIEGKLALDALAENSINFDEYFSKLIQELQKVHTIHLPKFGYINNGEGSDESYIYFLNRNLKEKIDELNSSNFNFPNGNKFLELLANTKLFQNDKPTLVHHDIGIDNVLVDSKNQIFIIDWDSSMSHVWSLDLAYLTFPSRDLHDLNLHKKKVEKIHALIKQNYTLPISFDEYLEREKIHHLYYLIGFIHHEYFNMENEKEAKAYLEYFNQLMN